jgi:hypothetical protein
VSLSHTATAAAAITAATAANCVQVLLAFKEYFPAMCCTDMLIRICDVMAVKPSELAFYPIPKLMIRRVGDHEQWSAWRAAEIGDGTREVTVISETVASNLV